jgi:outer membrane usher protein
VAYAGFDRDSVPSTIKLLGGFGYFQPAQHAHVLTVSYSVQIRTVSIYATGFRDFANGGSSGMLVGLTMPFGARSSAGVSAGTGSGGAYGQVQVQQSPVAIGDWGYQAFGTAATPDHEFAQAQYKSPWALLTTGVDQIGPQTTLRVETEGAVSFVDGGLFASNTINDSFAVVDTGGLANVHVLVENRDAGSTDTSGRLLVPDLRSFDANHLAIVPTDVPLDTTIDITTRQVRPQDRSGVVVKFPVKISHGALLRLLDEGGKPVAVGSTATLQATGAVVPIGYDGEAYLQDLDAHNEVAVERADGRRCRVGFDYAPVPGEIPTIGPVHCQEQSP